MPEKEVEAGEADEAEEFLDVVSTLANTLSRPLN
jgi:hypothetical protein